MCIWVCVRQCLVRIRTCGLWTECWFHLLWRHYIIVLTFCIITCLFPCNSYYRPHVCRMNLLLKTVFPLLHWWVSRWSHTVVWGRGYQPLKYQQIDKNTTSIPVMIWMDTINLLKLLLHFFRRHAYLPNVLRPFPVDLSNERRNIVWETIAQRYFNSILCIGLLYVYVCTWFVN